MAANIIYERLLNSSSPTWRSLIDLYTRIFEEGQRETERAILRNLDTPQRRGQGGHLVIAAQNASDACVGGIIFSYLPAIDCAYVSYLFVSAELRNRGVGTRLLEEMRKCLETEAASVGHGRVRG